MFWKALSCNISWIDGCYQISDIPASPSIWDRLEFTTRGMEFLTREAGKKLKPLNFRSKNEYCPPPVKKNSTPYVMSKNLEYQP